MKRLVTLLAFAIISLTLRAQLMDPVVVAPKSPEEQTLTHYQQNRDKYLHVSNDGAPMQSRLKVKDPRGAQLVRRGISAPKGLNGRHIALWQSHGRYFDLHDLTWKWQRPSLFQTSEDIFTQSFVVPFLVPMLENAGANVLIPRERDWHEFELIIDNDSTETSSPRIHGRMETSGKWARHDGGFADRRPNYVEEENPFTMGTYLQVGTMSKKVKEATASWWGVIDSHDEYAVYVSYHSLAQSTSDARYTIHTAGGPVSVSVNQKMGGGTWIYVGTYEFEDGERPLVSLTNKSGAEGVVTADAVRIGGGMGNIARGIKDSTEYAISGMPRFVEGARYHMQWSGIPAKVWSQNEFKDDYRDDLMSRGEWVQYISGGSWANPKKEGLKIPIDLSFAWHTDAGSKPDATIVGTLGIYTLRANGSTRLLSGSSRATSRELTEMLVSQIENDIKAQWDSAWVIRDVWNKSYSESRTTGTPAVLLELLSHQNFEDMKYGLDPAFRFAAARACYKAILKYLSTRYSVPYIVQPLPVRSFSAQLNTLSPEPQAELRWLDTDDPLEPTATPTQFIVQTRIDGRGWDSGRKVDAALINGWFQANIPIEEGHIYSYRVIASNEGGRSFPSEIMSVGLPKGHSDMQKVTIVNAFHRISAPKWFDTTLYAGFDTRNDSGVPYLRDWSFVGEQYEFSRGKVTHGGVDDGFGASYEDYQDRSIGGNSFDYPYIHGKAFFEEGYAFDSCSSECDTACERMLRKAGILDVICGKECVVRTGARSPQRGGIYSPSLMHILRIAVAEHKNIIISGAYIAKEAVEGGNEVSTFVRDSLGYSLRREHGSRTGQASIVGLRNGHLEFPVHPCAESYCVESPDALSAFRLGSSIAVEFSDSHLAAGVHIDFGAYKVAAFGFPLEILESDMQRSTLLRSILDYFKRD